MDLPADRPVVGSVPDMPVRARPLFGPGPSNPCPGATAAMAGADATPDEVALVPAALQQVLGR
jgi:hypothetical protein